ncbi:hypothetical protein IWW34DRAFT_636670, partial [Fusarium oxysporum f. sp. albedinis]
YEGFACECYKFRTISIQLMRYHFSKLAEDPCPDIDILPRYCDIENFKDIYLQMWPSRSHQRY